SGTERSPCTIGARADSETAGRPRCHPRCQRRHPVSWAKARRCCSPRRPGGSAGSHAGPAPATLRISLGATGRLRGTEWRSGVDRRIERSTVGATEEGSILGSRSRSFSLLASVLLIPAGLVAQAKFGVHPHVAPLAPGATIHGSSSQFNVPDGLWNHGEGFSAPYDAGGYHGIDDGSSIVWNDDPNDSNIVIEKDWAPHGNVLRLVGWLKPSGTDPDNTALYPRRGFSAETAFEIFAPMEWPTGSQLVAFVSTWGTIGISPHGRYHYPGDEDADGLMTDKDGNIARPPSDEIASFSQDPELGNIDIVAGYIVSPLPARDLTLTVQRTLQFERALRLILQHNPPNDTQHPDTEYPSLIEGGSAGGQVTSVLTTFYPDRFHGGISKAFSASVRRTVGDQETYSYHTSLLGFDHGSQALNTIDVLTWSKFYRDYPALPATRKGVSFHEGSFLTLWEANDASGSVWHPHWFMTGDEDTVTNGTEWWGLFTATPGTRPVWAETGHAQQQHPAGHQVDVYTTLIDRACHDAYHYKVPATLAGSGPVLRSDVIKAVIPFVKKYA